MSERVDNQPKASAELPARRTGLGERRGSPVAPIVLFFDLVYAFAINQLTLGLLLDLSVGGLVRTIILLMAVWAIWSLMAWITAHFDAESLPLRFMLMGVMVVSMLMFASFPHVDGTWGFGVALPMVAILFAWPVWLNRIGGRQPRFLRALLWAPVLAIPWIVGATASGSTQVAWWGVAVALIYAIAWMGYPVPGLGRSPPDDWAITGTRLSTRCGQMIVIGFGESFLVASGRLALRPPPPAELAAWMVAFLSSLALWLTYNESSVHARRAPTQNDTDSLWRSAYTYLHLPMLLGIITVAAAENVVIANPTVRTPMEWAVLILGAPALFLASNALFIWVLFKRVPHARLIAVVALVAMAPLAIQSSTLVLMTVVTSVVVAVALWEIVASRRLERLGSVRGDAELLENRR